MDSAFERRLERTEKEKKKKKEKEKKTEWEEMLLLLKEMKVLNLELSKRK